jgi:hypothetical protein
MYARNRQLPLCVYSMASKLIKEPGKHILLLTVTLVSMRREIITVPAPLLGGGHTHRAERGVGGQYFGRRET